MIIGQEKVIGTLLNIENFPRFLIICGDKYSGKTTVINEVINKRFGKAPLTVNTMDEIRQLEEKAISLQEDVVYLLEDYDTLNYRTKESVLKLCEDTPDHLYLVIETHDMSFVLPTMINRAFVVNMQPYTETQLCDYCSTHELSSTEVLRVCNNIGQIESLKAYGGNKVIQLVQKVYDYIFKASISNSMKIIGELKPKSDGDWIDMQLFFILLKNLIVSEWNVENEDQTDRTIKFLSATENAIKLLNNKSLNKTMIFDEWIFKLRL